MIQTHMPAEWHPHQAILLSWPHNVRTWPGHLAAVQDTYMTFIREIAESEDVWLFVENEQVEQDVRRRLRHACVSEERVKFFHHFTNDSWIRDYGPLCVYDANGKLAISDWQFNGWGGKYSATEDYLFDNQVPQVVADHLQVDRVAKNLILEGGSIDLNGRGTLLTSESCLLNENRNSHLTKSQITQELKDTLGAKHIVWVPEGIVGDDTDGHIDDTVRFVNETTVVCAYEENPKDENHEPLKLAYEALSKSFDQDGRPLQVVKLPMPSPFYVDGERLPASYANFLICNTKALVPIFKCKEDAVALKILQEQFPGRKVVGIDARALVVGYGSLHCLSQQVPTNLL